ncbi:MAG: hypothetical protein HY240_00200 [Actinobacteria bacterium]|nr:hypothetical protein [Actinomycetota bacterium]
MARWIPAAAAAVLVGLLAIALPRLGGGSATQSAPQAASVGASEQAPMPGTGGALSAVLERGVTLERQSKDYGQGDVKALTDDTAAAFAGAELPDTLTKQATFAGAERDALACLFDQIPKSPNTVLVRLIQATYEGQPAYLAIFVHGPAPGEPADRVQTWVVLVKGCTIASLAERVL